MPTARRAPKEERRLILQIVQPGLLGLMDGSVSTLAPLFATAAMTGKPHDAFVVGLAASLGAGISMGWRRLYPMTARYPVEETRSSGEV